jgi:RimJ/RimL family protein N-acetyltransferase
MKDLVPRYLYTERLVLELFDRGIPEHYECLLGSMNSPTAHARMGDFGIRTPAEFDALNNATRITRAYSQGMVPDLDFYYIIRISGEDGPMIGGVSLAQREAAVPPDMGWCIQEPHMGKGYATEGAQEFLRYLREDFGLQEIMVWPGSTNRESCRVAQKLGFVEGGSVRSKEEPGKVDVVYVLPGMKLNLEKDHTLSLWGDKGSAEQA